MQSSDGTIILLNGTPSSGKTTLGHAVNAAFPEPAFFLPLDSFRLAVPERFWTGPNLGALFGVMLDAWLSCLRDVARRGLPVIAESSITPENREQYDEIFGDLRVLLVGVRCPLDVVRRREAGRTDRLNGPYDVTTDEIELVHRHDYAIDVDTSEEPTAESVTRILAGWAGLR